jgi:hypothetical protein
MGSQYKRLQKARSEGKILMKQPDPRLHQHISFAKSGLRIVAGIGLMTGVIHAAGLFLILAEILGIAEELV